VRAYRGYFRDWSLTKSQTVKILKRVGIFGGNAAWREGSQLKHPKKPTARVNSEVAVRCTDLDAKKLRVIRLGMSKHIVCVRKKKTKKISRSGG
jgi:hypothetical protein